MGRLKIMSDEKENTVNPATEEPVQAAEGTAEEVPAAAEPVTAEAEATIESAASAEPVATVGPVANEGAPPEAPAEK